MPRWRASAAVLLAAGVVSTAVGSAAPSGAASRPPDVIRIGGPSEPEDVKIAVLASTERHAGEPFTVVDTSGATVLTGTLVRARKPSPWAYVATADLSSIQTPGTYRVRAAGLQSRPWVIRNGADTEAITTLLRFFAANRDGAEPSPLHDPAHLNDATVSGGPHDGEEIDLTGGWMDAGDMIHFTVTTAYTATVLQLAALIDPAHAGALRAEAAVGVRWLVKAHPAPDLFIGQVGDQRDHDLGFRDPALDDASTLPGIGHRLAYPSTGSGLSGLAAAALALAAEGASGSQRDLLLAQAEQWYASGKTTAGPGPRLPGGFYRDASWKDDLALGAVMLWRVTGEAQYRTDAQTYLSQADTTDLGWSEVGALAGADLCGLLGHAPADATARSLGCANLQSVAASALAQARDNAPWGTPGWFGWGQTGANGGMGAAIALAARGGIVEDERFATRARDWLLGENPWGASFVVGYGPASPKHPHHWASVFGPAQPVGAVVGGAAPQAQIRAQGFAANGRFDSARAAYEDQLENYVTSEPALDYTVNTILLLAALGAI